MNLCVALWKWLVIKYPTSWSIGKRQYCNYQWLLCGVCSRCGILIAVQYAPWYSSPVIIRIFVNQARLNDAYGLKAVRLGIPTVLACAVLKLLQFLLSGQPNKYKGGDAGYAIWRHHVPWLWWFKKCAQIGNPFWLLIIPNLCYLIIFQGLPLLKNLFKSFIIGAFSQRFGNWLSFPPQKSAYIPMHD